MFFGLVLIPAVHNYILKELIKVNFNSPNVRIESLDVVLSTKKIKLKNLTINLFASKMSIPLTEIYFDIDSMIYKRKTDFSLVAENIQMGNQFSLRLEAKGKYNLRNDGIECLPVISTLKGQYNFSLSSKMKFEKNSLLIENTKVQLNEGLLLTDTKIDFKKNNVDSIQSLTSFKHIPLDFYKIFFNPEHDLYKFFQESIHSGLLQSGSVTVNIPSEFFALMKPTSSKEISSFFKKEYVKGNFTISNLTYKYSDYMPDIKSNLMDIKIGGQSVSIDIKNATIGDTKVIDGNVSFDYLSDNFTVYADASASGNIKGLVSFIEPESMSKMKNSNIDLLQLNGSASSKIHLEIPVATDSPNKYDIQTSITGVSGKLFNEDVRIENYNILGSFNGKSVNLSGKGEVNNFKSDLSLLVNLEEGTEISHKINTKIHFTQSDKIIAGIKFLDGVSDLEVEILGKKELVTLNANANLRNIHFLIPSISLSKEKGKKANLKITGTLEEGTKQKINLSLAGEDNLKIEGVIRTNGSISTLTFDKVMHLNNDFKAEVVTGGKTMVAKVYGKLIDLSEADFANLLNSQNNHIDDVKLHIMLDSVRLKNNIFLTGTMIDAECSRGICPVARFHSQMQGYILRAEYHANQLGPYWDFNTNNAGMLFTAFGITNKIKNGQMNIIINTPPKYNNPQEQYYTGKFSINNFDSTQNKFLARMVSFISIPGLVGTLTNKDIHFDNLKGEFKIQKGVFSFTETSAEGPYFNFFLKGAIDVTNRKIDFRGQVVPSLYGLNKLMGSIPLIRALFGKKRGGLVFTPFSMHETY